jgi:DNA-directed RNA polymerase subunit RPC12/RpoP
MTELVCQKCGTSYDTDRERQAGDYGDRERCPYCGTKNSPEETAATGRAPNRATDGGSSRRTEVGTVNVPQGATVRITIEVVPE